MIFFSRVTPYVRPFACFPAGITRMPLPRFFVSALGGSVLWCVSILFVGWMLGRRWGVALALVRHYTFPALIVFILLVALYCAASSVGKRVFQAKLQSTRTQSSANDDVTTSGRDLLEV
jgi:membrane protein DedA with SNARE-associated domain